MRNLTLRFRLSYFYCLHMQVKIFYYSGLLKNVEKFRVTLNISVTLLNSSYITKALLHFGEI